VIGCKTVPVTGRKQINLVPDAMLTAMALTEYDSVIVHSTTLTPNDEMAQMVATVGLNIQHAVETYMQQNNMSKDLKHFKWEYHTIDEPTINAWCMPGGKVVVYTGLLPYTQKYYHTM
jgi:Zn-dependent protease with chaperone function